MDSGMTLWCDQRYSVDGIELAWGEVGNGKPLVLVHGWTGSAHDFTLRIHELSRDRRVLAIDHRGHGHSASAAHLQSHSIARLAADLEAWADDVIGEPFDLLGHSMGGRVVIDYALARPEMLRSLILMDTTAWRMDVGNPKLEGWLANVSDAKFREYLLRDDLSDEAIAIRSAVPATWLLENTANKERVDPMGARALGLEIFTTDPRTAERLGEITCPVTVIVGENDHPFVDHAPRLVDALPNGVSTQIDGAWHSPQLTHPEQWLAAVRAHLGRI